MLPTSLDSCRPNLLFFGFFFICFWFGACLDEGLFGFSVLEFLLQKISLFPLSKDASKKTVSFRIYIYIYTYVEN